MGADLFHADRRTDRHDELNSRFSKFFKASKTNPEDFSMKPAGIQTYGHRIEG